MAAGSIYQVKLLTTVLGKDCLNVFYFQQQAGGTVSGNLAEAVNNAFWASIDTELLALLHPSVTVKSSDLIELDFPAAWNLKVINTPGTWTDASEQGAAPRFLSAGFRYTRVSPGQRNGYKRFAGFAIEALEDGEFGAAFTVLAGDLQDKLEVGFTAGTINFVPFVAKRPTPLGSNPLGYVPTGVDFYGVGTQNTRK